MSEINRNWAKGEKFVAIKPSGSNGWYYVSSNEDHPGMADVATCHSIDGSVKANAELIADAFNTANKTGLTPSELLEQRDNLIEALDVIELHLQYGRIDAAISRTKKTIANAKNIEL